MCVVFFLYLLSLLFLSVCLSLSLSLSIPPSLSLSAPIPLPLSLSRPSLSPSVPLPPPFLSAKCTARLNLYHRLSSRCSDFDGDFSGILSRNDMGCRLGLGTVTSPVPLTCTHCWQGLHVFRKMLAFAEKVFLVTGSWPVTNSLTCTHNACFQKNAGLCWESFFSDWKLTSHKFLDLYPQCMFSEKCWPLLRKFF